MEALRAPRLPFRPQTGAGIVVGSSSTSVSGLVPSATTDLAVSTALSSVLERLPPVLQLNSFHLGSITVQIITEYSESKHQNTMCIGFRISRAVVSRVWMR
jgi:hypothetical protein